MKAKVLPLITSSFLVLSIYSAQAFNTLDNESPRYKMPKRYHHLKELKNEALREARKEAQESRGVKYVGFRNTIEIHAIDFEKEWNEDSKENIQVSKSTVNPSTKPKLEKRLAVPKLKLTEERVISSDVEENKVIKPENSTQHKRGAGNIVNLEQLFAKPLSPRAQEQLNTMVGRVSIEKASIEGLTTWAKLGNISAQHELGGRLMNRKPLTALKWIGKAVEQGDEQSVALQAKILDRLEKRHARIIALHDHHFRKKIRSEIENPCLPAQVPLFPFSGEKIGDNQVWKKWYMQASLILTDDPFNPEAKNLLDAVSQLKPSFKDAYFRLYLVELAKGNKEEAMIYLKKAALGPKGLDVAQYQMGLHLLKQGRQIAAERWLKKASDQKYWLADEELKKLYSEKKEMLEKILNEHNRSIKINP
ncbi:MAG: hypothetical protein BGO77_07375 [Caedibacter sp. 37-49]|nr:MAG: hypothetical protein BGO77_07375 [Caedibacter sp. 37-49]